MQISNSILEFFIPSAHADVASAAPAPQGGGFSFVAMMVFIIVLMYFMVLRPQTKRAKEHRDLVGSLAKGDEVVTTGGILGTITKISDNYIVLGLNESVEICVQKNAVATVLPKGTIKAI